MNAYAVTHYPTGETKFFTDYQRAMKAIRASGFQARFESNRDLDTPRMRKIERYGQFYWIKVNGIREEFDEFRRQLAAS